PTRWRKWKRWSIPRRCPDHATMQPSFPKSTPKATELDDARLKHFVDKMWDDSVVPSLVEYIRIPNKSPAFDKDWVAHGHMDAAVALMEKWARAQLERIPGATLEVLRLPNRTPLIFIE